MAYAAAISLLQILKQIQLSNQSSNTLYPKSQIHLLYEQVRFFKYFLEENRDFESEYESEIRDAIYEAEDVVESYVSSQFLSSEAETQIFSQKLQRVMLKIMTAIAQVMEKFTDHDSGPQINTSLREGRSRGSSFTSPAKNPFFGRFEDTIQLIDQLTGFASGLKVVAVVGIPGIGKTTLAQHVYSHSYMERHFDIRVWVTLSPRYGIRDVLLELLSSMLNLSDKMSHMTEDGLGEHVYKFLFGRRYLIVLDDVRDIEVWEKIRIFFGDCNNGSRVILTTENVEVAKFAVPNGPLLQLTPLNIDDSWALLCQIVFGNESSPRELGEITMDIAASCKGLPSAIITIGRLLSLVSITEWKRVASSIHNCSNHVEPMDVLVSLSYECLPQNLKACLLYLGIFPYSHEIPVSRLIRLWIAEGFIDSTLPESLEEMAEDYLLELINRNLVLVCKRRSNGGIRTCRVNQAFHDFIMRKAEKEKFFHVINENIKSFQEDTNNQRRLCIHKSISFGTEFALTRSVSTLRSLLFTGPQREYQLHEWLDFNMLRVLDALNIRFYNFPSQFLKLVHLRYLALRYEGRPPSLCNLSNLQFLILVSSYLRMKIPFYLPLEIWKMKELRHLQLSGDLPDPSTAASENDDGKDNHLMLENLLTLTDVSAHSCTPQILTRIPNLKKLGILIGSSLSDQDAAVFFNHLHILNRLESFKCIVMHPYGIGAGFRVVSSFSFPSTLRKISLRGGGFPWEHMSVIGSLPNLEVLKLRSYAFRGPDWEMIEGEFLRLSFLLLEDMDVEYWRADSINFPVLRYLIIRRCYELREIPLEFGDIATLERIELVNCSPSAMDSARRIQEEQLELGNDNIQIILRHHE